MAEKRVKLFVGMKCKYYTVDAIIGSISRHQNRDNQIFIYTNSLSYQGSSPSASGEKAPGHYGKKYSYWVGDMKDYEDGKICIHPIDTTQERQGEALDEAIIAKSDGKEAVMLKCIKDNFKNTDDALVVEKHFATSLNDTFIASLMLHKYNEEIKKEAYRREEEWQAKEAKIAHKK
jgi:hypothetical protein